MSEPNNGLLTRNYYLSIFGYLDLAISLTYANDSLVPLPEEATWHLDDIRERAFASRSMLLEREFSRRNL